MSVSSSPRHKFSPIRTNEDGAVTTRGAILPRLQQQDSEVAAMDSPSEHHFAASDDVTIEMLSVVHAEPTTLAAALAALREAQAEITLLQSRLADDIHNHSKPFESRGLDHSDALRDQSQSTTRNKLERAYEDATDESSHVAHDVSSGYCCRCIPWGRNSSGQQSTLTLDQYFATPFYWLMAKRLPWLIVLLLIQSFSASILASYNTYLEAHIVFTYFIAMIVGTGGNAGNQCSVLVTRALALGMGDADVIRVVKKEAPIAVMTAVMLGLFAFLRVIVEYPDDMRPAAAIAVTLGVSICISIALGIAFSYGIEKLNRCDPADGAAPLLNTISDLIGISILCSVAYAIVP